MGCGWANEHNKKEQRLHGFTCGMGGHAAMWCILVERSTVDSMFSCASYIGVFHQDTPRGMCQLYFLFFIFVFFSEKF